MAAQPEMTPEQQEEMRKKIEAMSPEELKEFQKQQCIFCHIVSGKVAAKKVFEDEKTLAVLDINPANPGHILLMPKEHYMIMPQMPEQELSHIFMVTKHLSNVLLKKLDVRGTNIFVANGGAAGQRAQHFMVHIIPRKEGDGLSFDLPSNKFSDNELNKTADIIKKKLSELIPIKEKPKTALDILKSSEKKGEKPKEIVIKEDKPAEKIEQMPSEKSQKPKSEPEKKDTPKKSPKEEKDDDENDEDNNDEKSDASDEIDLDKIARMFNG